MSSKTLVLAAALAAISLPALAEEDRLAQIRDVFAAHEKALDQHDLKGVMALYAPGDQTAVLGTGPGEQWVGGEQIEDAYRHFFADFDAGTVDRTCPWMLGNVSGDVGWISATCDYRDSLKDKPRTFALNVSAVLQKLDGAWKLRTMHFSNPTSP
jgi:uncharacterized protein (TIGR02246 family)